MATARGGPLLREGKAYKGRKWNGAIGYSVSSKELKGSLDSGKSVEIKTIANAMTMPSEYEEDHILILSNDPDQPQKKIKVTAQKLSEKAGLIFRPSSLSFPKHTPDKPTSSRLILVTQEPSR